MRESKRYRRTYTWNERNQLVSSVDSNYSTAYVYGQDGQRSNKYTQNSETLYFNKMWTLHTDSGNSVYGGQSSKHIYLGETRIVTKLNSGTSPTYQEEYYKQYFYHSDHLGSASLISDYKGDEYQRIEYTPYGETWVEKTQNVGLEYLPYKFTAKELDEETGLYYFGARYLDPKYSRWLSTDPALSEYMAGSSVGCGGIYNSANLNLYHYAGNNPLKYTDPDGKADIVDGDIPSSFTTVDRQSGRIINSPGLNYVEHDLQNYFITGNANYLKKLPDINCSPLAMAALEVEICEHYGIELKSIIPGVSSKAILGILTASSLDIAETAQKAGGSVVGKIGKLTAKNTDIARPLRRNPELDFINGKGKSTLETHAKKHGYSVTNNYLNDARSFLTKKQLRQPNHYCQLRGHILDTIMPQMSLG